MAKRLSKGKIHYKKYERIRMNRDTRRKEAQVQFIDVDKDIAKWRQIVDTLIQRCNAIKARYAELEAENARLRQYIRHLEGRIT